MVTYGAAVDELRHVTPGTGTYAFFQALLDWLPNLGVALLAFIVGVTLVRKRPRDDSN